MKQATFEARIRAATGASRKTEQRVALRWLRDKLRGELRKADDEPSHCVIREQLELTELALSKAAA